MLFREAGCTMDGSESERISEEHYNDVLSGGGAF